METIFKDACKINKMKECVTNFNNMRSILEPFNTYRSTLQGIIIRSHIGIQKVMNDIFIGRFGFNFTFLLWTVDDIYKTYSELFGTDHKFNELEKKMNNYIKTNLTANNLYMIYFILPGHANLHFVDKRNSICYIYEPEMTDSNPSYWLLNDLKTIYRTNGYTIGELPSVILKQNNLPLCYMYAVHFFLYMYITNQNQVAIQKYMSTCDDLFIMKFTKNILKLCHEYGLIEDIPYYMVTDNTYKIQKLLETQKSLTIDHSILYLTSELMFKITKNNIKLNIANFVELLLINKYHICIELIEMFMSIIPYINNINNNLKAEIYIIGKLLVIYITDIPASDSIINTINKRSYELKINKICGQLELDRNVILAINNIINDRARDHNGTALIIATYYKKIRFVEYLLNINSDINAVDFDNYKAMDYALNEPNILNLLIGHQKTQHKVLQPQLQPKLQPQPQLQPPQPQPQLQPKLQPLQPKLQPPQLQPPQPKLQPPLLNSTYQQLFNIVEKSSVIKNNDIDTFTILLNNITDPNLKNSSGKTLLHYVLQKDVRNLIGPLIRKGASETIVDNDNKSPIYFINQKARAEVMNIINKNKVQTGGYYRKYLKYKNKYVRHVPFDL